ncbi:MAG: hypothetical protein GX351_07870 [Peptococcaceae bacterium]|nr:hypothetical protein [Peptococcaceae bacterium]
MPRYIEQITNIARSIPKVKDSITLGVISGLLGTLALDILNLRNWRRNKTESLYGHIAGSIFMKGFRTKRRGNFLFGQINHMLSGALAGIPLVYLFKFTGKDHPILKGASYGSVIWMVYYVLGIKSGLFRSSPKLNKSHKSNLWQNLVFGVASAKAITSLADPSIFRTAPLEEQKLDGEAKVSPGAWTLPYYTDYETEKAIH